jgi:CheY-like chemotaxis protein
VFEVKRALGGLQLTTAAVFAGFDGYLSKPVDIPDFVATVKRYCGLSQASGS